MYRVTATTVKTDNFWQGMCAVVSAEGRFLVFPNGEKAPYVRLPSGFRITKGPHRGFYEVQKLQNGVCVESCTANEALSRE